MDHDDMTEMPFEALEAFLDDRADAAARQVLAEKLTGSASARTDYGRQIRVHLMLKEHFSLAQAVRRPSRGVLKAVAAVLLVVGVVAVVCSTGRSPARCLRVEAAEAEVLSAEELECLKMRYFAERSPSSASAAEIVKYEPGSVANPGAAIEVLEMSVAKRAGQHLNVGDRVWRKEIVLSEGQLRFQVGARNVVTAVGPAVVRLPDGQTVEVVSGCAFVEARQPVNLVLMGHRIVLNDTSAGVVVRADGSAGDLLVTDGLVLLQDGCCLRSQSGVRFSSDGSRQTYRSASDGQMLQGAFLAGISDVRIERSSNRVL